MYRFWKVGLMTVAMVAVMFACSGCASVLVYKDSEKKAAAGKGAIQAVPLEGGAGLGVDLSALETLGKQPFKQLGAAGLDALMMWGAYRGVESIVNQGSGGDSSADGDLNQVNVNGQGNTVNIGNSTDNSDNSADNSTK